MPEQQNLWDADWQPVDEKDDPFAGDWEAVAPESKSPWEADWQPERKEAPTFGGRIKESWETGKKQVGLGGLGFQKILGDEAPETEEQIQAIQEAMPQGIGPERSLPEQAVSAAAEMAPIPLSGMEKGVKRGVPLAVGFGTIAALAGPAAPITVPAAAAAGMSVGMVSASLENIAGIEAGLAYLDFRDLKDPDTGEKMNDTVAKIAGLGVGIVNGGIELLQIKTFLRSIPGLEGLVRKGINKSVKKALKSKSLKRIAFDATKKYTGGVATETGQEVMQEFVNISGQYMATEVNNALKGTNIPKQTQEQVVDQLLETAKQSALAFSVFMAPGTAVSTTGDVVTRKKGAIGESHDLLTDDKKAGEFEKTLRENFNSGKLNSGDLAKFKATLPKKHTAHKIIDDLLKESQASTVEKDLMTGEDLNLTPEEVGPEPPIIPVEQVGFEQVTEEMPIEHPETAIPMPGAYPELAGVSAKDSAWEFEQERIEGERREKEEILLQKERENEALRLQKEEATKEERVRQSRAGYEGLVGEVAERAEREGVEGLEYTVPYLEGLLERTKLGEPGKRIKVEDYDGTEKWFGVGSDYPEFMVSRYGKKEVIKALEKGLAGYEFPLREVRQAQIWDDAKEQAIEMRNHDLRTAAEMYIEEPETIEGLPDSDYKLLITELQNEGHDTRAIEEIAARHRKEIEGDVIAEIANDHGFPEEEIRALIADPLEPIADLEIAWKEATKTKPVSAYLTPITEAEHYDIEEERRLARPEREGKEPGRAIPVEGRGAKEVKAGRVLQEPSAEETKQKGELIASLINEKLLPGHKLHYDGIFAFMPGIPSVYQFTPHAGPAHRYTIAHTDLEADKILEKLKTKIDQCLAAKAKKEAPKEEFKEAIDLAAGEAETEPTEAQKEAGNYKMGHITVQGLDITIENPKGSTRKGVSKAGKAWETKLKHHYGYFKRTLGKDGDQVDVFVGDDVLSDQVFIINQVDPGTKKFDEHKVMVGFKTVEQARVAYLANYERGWTGLGNVVSLSVDEFKTWLKDGDQKKPASKADITEHGLDFLKWHKTKEELERTYQGQIKMLEGRKDIPEPARADLIAKVESAYEIESRKYPAEKVGRVTRPEFSELVQKAQKWKGAAINADKLYPKDDKRARLKHSQMTTKGDLDAYLRKEFGLDALTARGVSNQLTKENLPPKSTNVEAFRGEPWADAALAYKEKPDRITKPVPKETLREVFKDPAASQAEVIREKAHLKRQVIEGVKSGKYKGAVRFSTVVDLKKTIEQDKFYVSGYGEIHATPILGPDDDAFPAYGSYKNHAVAYIIPEKHIKGKPDAYTKEVLVDPDASLADITFLVDGQDKEFDILDMINAVEGAKRPILEELMKEYHDKHGKSETYELFKDTKDDAGRYDWRGAVIHKSTLHEGGWRITYFDEDGFSNHSEHKTVEACFEAAIYDGIVTPKPGLLDKAAKKKGFIEKTVGTYDAQMAHFKKMTGAEKEPPLSLPKVVASWPAGKRKTFKVDKSIERASKAYSIEGSTSDAIVATDLFSGPPVTPEFVLESIDLNTKAYESLSGRLGGKNARARQNASPLDMMESWVDANQWTNTLNAWKEKFPPGWTAYVVRQERIKKLNPGDPVFVPLGNFKDNPEGTPGTIVKQNRVNWVVKPEGLHNAISYNPAHLRPGKVKEEKTGKVDAEATRKQIKSILTKLKNGLKRGPDGEYKATQTSLDTLYDDLKWKLNDLREQGDLDEKTIDAIKVAGIADQAHLVRILPEAEKEEKAAESNVDKQLRAAGAKNKHFYLDDFVDYISERQNKRETFTKTVSGKQVSVTNVAAGNAIFKLDGLRTYAPAAFDDAYNKAPAWLRSIHDEWERDQGRDPESPVGVKAEKKAPVVEYHDAETLAKQGFTSWDSRQGYDTDEDALQLLSHWQGRNPLVEFKLSRHDDGTLSVWGKPAELHLMTKSEQVENVGRPIKEHREAIVAAHEAGKTIPTEVLNDFPEISKRLGFKKKEKAVGVAKQKAWQLTPAEFDAKRSTIRTAWLKDVIQYVGREDEYGTEPLHKTVVRKALKEGKGVPDNVLAKYPELEMEFLVKKLIKEGKKHGESDDLIDVVSGEKYTYKTRQLVKSIRFLLEERPDLGTRLPSELDEYFMAGAEKEPLVLTPEKGTPWERQAELEKEGIVKRPEKEPSQRAAFPKGGISKAGMVGRQQGLFGAEKGETIDMFAEAEKKAELPILSVSEPVNVRGKVSDGNWSVSYEVPSTLGETGRQVNKKYFWKKKDAQAWVEETRKSIESVAEEAAGPVLETAKDYRDMIWGTTNEINKLQARKDKLQKQAEKLIPNTPKRTELTAKGREISETLKSLRAEIQGWRDALAKLEKKEAKVFVETLDQVRENAKKGKKAGIEYVAQMEVAETGDVVDVSMDAGTALVEADKRLENYNKLLECIESD